MTETQHFKPGAERKKREERGLKRPSFNFFAYAESFDFCDRPEKLRLLSLLQECWTWAYPVKDCGEPPQDENEPATPDIIDETKLIAAKINAYERYRREKKRRRSAPPNIAAPLDMNQAARDY